MQALSPSKRIPTVRNLDLPVIDRAANSSFSYVMSAVESIIDRPISKKGIRDFSYGIRGLYSLFGDT